MGSRAMAKVRAMGRTMLGGWRLVVVSDGACRGVGYTRRGRVAVLVLVCL